jgi:multicomponent Na+:H+ antiporter subunit D
MLFYPAVLLPLLSVLLIPIKKMNRKAFYILLMLVASVHFTITLFVPVGSGTAIPQLHLVFEVDKYAKLFLILISGSWIISIIYSYDYTKYHFQEKTRQFFLLLNTLLSVIALNACSGSLITLLVFYLLGIPLAYPLIKLRGDEPMIAAAKSYLKQTLFPVIFLVIPAIYFTYRFTRHTTFTAGNTFGSLQVDPLVGGLVFALFVIGFSKNSIFPFNTWLPEVHLAPAPLSGLVHSVAGVKTASIATIKIAVYIFGLDYIRLLASSFFTGGWLVYACGFTALFAAVKAFKTDDLKQRFSYSTVSQLSYIVLAVLIGTETGIMAAALHIVTHAFAKPTLFYVAGFFNSFYETTSAKAISKLMPANQFMAFIIASCGLSITGFPLLAGYYSKDLMLIEEWSTGNYASSLFLLTGSIINVFYIFPVVKAAFNPLEPDVALKPVPKAMFATFAISLVLIFTSNAYMTYLSLIIR